MLYEDGAHEILDLTEEHWELVEEEDNASLPVSSDRLFFSLLFSTHLFCTCVYLFGLLHGCTSDTRDCSWSKWFVRLWHVSFIHLTSHSWQVIDDLDYDSEYKYSIEVATFAVGISLVTIMSDWVWSIQIRTRSLWHAG